MHELSIARSIVELVEEDVLVHVPPEVAQLAVGARRLLAGQGSRRRRGSGR